MAEKGWKAYSAVAINEIPRLALDKAELQHRCLLMQYRDHAQKQRETARWPEDMILVDMIALGGPTALSSKLRPDQVAALWEVMSELASTLSKLRAIGLD